MVSRAKAPRHAPEEVDAYRELIERIVWARMKILGHT